MSPPRNSRFACSLCLKEENPEFFQVPEPNGETELGIFSSPGAKGEEAWIFFFYQEEFKSANEFV